MLAAVLLVVHLLVFMIPLAHLEEWKLKWSTVMVLEYPVFVYFRSRLPIPSLDRSCKAAQAALRGGLAKILTVHLARFRQAHQ
jgi:hypothetical protein